MVDGTERTEGRVEIFDLGQWKTMCADDLGLEEAQAVCRQLGMPPPSMTLPGGRFGGSDTLEMLGETFHCLEHQKNLGECTRSMRSTPCTVEDAVVQCGSWKDGKCSDLPKEPSQIPSPKYPYQIPLLATPPRYPSDKTPPRYPS